MDPPDESACWEEQGLRVGGKPAQMVWALKAEVMAQRSPGESACWDGEGLRVGGKPARMLHIVKALLMSLVSSRCDGRRPKECERASIIHPVCCIHPPLPRLLMALVSSGVQHSTRY